MKAIIDVSGMQAVVFGTVSGGISEKWTAQEFDAYVKTNYGSVVGRRGVETSFPVASGDTLQLDTNGIPVSRVNIPKPDSLDVRCESPEDFDHTPAVAADGKSIHTIQVRRMKESGDVNRADSFTTIVLRTNQLLPVSTGSQKLVSGMATFSVGPSNVPGDVKVTISDKSLAMKSVPIMVRFL